MKKFLALLLALALASCGLFEPTVNPGPEPTPIPVPPDPGPGPQPDPTPDPGPKPPAPAGALTPAQYDAVAKGMTVAQMTALIGDTRQKTPHASGIVFWVYPAVDETGALLDAEFWVKGGVVVNKNRL